MDSELEEALRLAAEIAQDRAALRKKEEIFAALFGMRGIRSYEKNGQLDRLQIAVTDGGDAPVAERLRAYFRGNPGRDVSVAEMRKKLRDVDAKLIRSTSHRLAGKKYGMPGLKSVGRGLYRYDPQEQLL